MPTMAVLASTMEEHTNNILATIQDNVKEAMVELYKQFDSQIRKDVEEGMRIAKGEVENTVQEK